MSASGEIAMWIIYIAFIMYVGTMMTCWFFIKSKIPNKAERKIYIKKIELYATLSFFFSPLFVLSALLLQYPNFTESKIKVATFLIFILMLVVSVVRSYFAFKLLRLEIRQLKNP